MQKRCALMIMYGICIMMNLMIWMTLQKAVHYDRKNMQSIHAVL